MASNIVVTLAIGEGDPPAVVLTASADGQPLFGEPKSPDPSDVMGLAAALEQATGEQGVRDAVRSMMAPILDALTQRVAEDDERQRVRRDQLAKWQEAVGVPPQP